MGSRVGRDLICRTVTSGEVVSGGVLSGVFLTSTLGRRISKDAAFAAGHLEDIAYCVLQVKDVLRATRKKESRVRGFPAAGVVPLMVATSVPCGLI